MSTKKSENIKAVIRRLKFAKGFKTDIQVANYLNEKPKTISAWQARNTKSALEKIIKICREDVDINLGFLLTGKETGKERERKDLEFEFLRDIESWLLEESKKDERTLPYFEKMIEKTFPEFMEWKRKTDKNREDSSIQEANIA